MNATRAHDAFFMKESLRLARKGEGMTSPNPMVGAVLVSKDGRLIGSGYHKKAGFPHAEINAIAYAKKHFPRALRNATLYVTLEPCVHFGRTPPCVEAIITHKIETVVSAMIDPNALVRGRGIARLKKSGIRIRLGVLGKEAARLNEAYVKFIRKGIPFVTVKVAQSLDGKIATRTGDSQWISSRESRMFAHRLRSINDAVLVGTTTLLRDDPSLTARDAGTRLLENRQPLRVVLDRRLRISAKARLLRTPTPVLIATTDMAPKKYVRALEKRFSFVTVRSFGKKAIDVVALARYLGKKGIVSLLVEGGGNTIAEFFEKKLVDKAFFITAPKVIGGSDAPSAVEGKGAAGLNKAICAKKIFTKELGNDIIIEAYF